MNHKEDDKKGNIHINDKQNIEAEITRDIAELEVTINRITENNYEDNDDIIDSNIIDDIIDIDRKTGPIPDSR